MRQETVEIPKIEYDDMLEYMERLQETIDVLSNKETIKKLNNALNRIEAGEFLTKRDMLVEDI